MHEVFEFVTSELYMTFLTLCNRIVVVEFKNTVIKLFFYRGVVSEMAYNFCLSQTNLN